MNPSIHANNAPFHEIAPADPFVTRRIFQQMPLEDRDGKDAILNSNYLADVDHYTESWSSKRIVLIHSKALDASTSVISDLKKKLGKRIVASKSGVGAHSPYLDVIEIAQLLYRHEADTLISIGSSSYSDACKIARLLADEFGTDEFDVDDVEALVDKEKGVAKNLPWTSTRLIVVPTSLSASEWNHVSSATNPKTHKKQHFSGPNSAPDLIVLDPKVASTSPRTLWLSSGMRAVDHCVETICNPQCHSEAFEHMQRALQLLLKGLRDYKDGEKEEIRENLLRGISECQFGSRQAMMGILLWRIPMGPSHAIGHQLGSAKGVMHGVTTCVMLAPVLRYSANKAKGGGPHAEKTLQSQQKVLDIFNETLGWQESTAADAVEKIVKFLELPSNLKEVDVTEQADFEKVAEMTMTDIWGGGERQVKTKEDVLDILELARG